MPPLVLEWLLGIVAELCDDQSVLSQADVKHEHGLSDPT